MVRPVRPRPATLLAAVVAAAAFGCQEREGIRSYSITRTTGNDKSAAPAGEYRILGAIFPADKPAWFFKLTGTAEQVGKAEELFDKVVKSVRFPNGLRNPPVFDVPDGARLGGGRDGMVPIHETILFGPGGPEATVIASSGEVLGNVGRWAGQVGAPPPTDADLSKYARPFTAEKVDGLRVDVRGPSNPSTRGMGGPRMPPGR